MGEQPVSGVDTWLYALSGALALLALVLLAIDLRRSVRRRAAEQADRGTHRGVLGCPTCRPQQPNQGRELYCGASYHHAASTKRMNPIAWNARFPGARPHHNHQERELSTQPLCIYHHGTAGCPDGFTAAWLVARAHPDGAELYPAAYGDEPPDATGRQVWIVDFSFPREQLRELAARAEHVTVIDHHQTAQEQLLGLAMEVPNLVTVFNEDYSGAMLTWHVLHENAPAPPLVQHVQDRDLWRFELKGTAEVFAAMTSCPYTLEDWDKLAATPIQQLVEEGQAIARYRARLIEQAVAGAVLVNIGDHLVPAANAAYAIGSDVAGELARGEEFGAYWYEHQGWRHVGLRSEPGGRDVAKVAEQYGGGGHRHAAGFKEWVAANDGQR